MSGGSLEGTLTLNDDLTSDISISDCGKAIQLQREMAHARRNYADQATIEEYTKQLNELMSAKMTCKGVNQEIPMKLQTEKFEPMAGAIVTVRQLLQFVQTFLMQMRVNQAQAQAGNE